MNRSLKVAKATYVPGGSGHLVRVSFSDGSEGTADYASRLYGLLEPLKDQKLFKKVSVHHGALTWPGDIDISAESTYALAHDMKRPKTMSEVSANMVSVMLRELREKANLTQAEMADRMSVSQPAVAALEKGTDFKWSSLARYVEALGGKIDLAIVVDGERVILSKRNDVPVAKKKQAERTPTSIYDIGPFLAQKKRTASAAGKVAVKKIGEAAGKVAGGTSHPTRRPAIAAFKRGQKSPA